MTPDHQTAAPGTAAPSVDRGGIITGIGALLVGTAVVLYGMSMPGMGDGQPGAGLFPMLIGGLLILFGLLLVVTTVFSGRRAVAQEAAPTAGPTELAGNDGTASATDPVPDDPSPAGTVSVGGEAAGPDVQTRAVLTDDIGADGARRWINAAVVLGAILAFIPLTPVLGFPISMFLVVATILLTLRTRWWVALVIAACASLSLWALFEQGLMVQLPDGFIEGF